MIVAEDSLPVRRFLIGKHVDVLRGGFTARKCRVISFTYYERDETHGFFGANVQPVQPIGLKYSVRVSNGATFKDVEVYDWMIEAST